MMATPLRNIRVEDDLWRRLRERAERDGTDASAIIRRLITDYLDK